MLASLKDHVEVVQRLLLFTNIGVNVQDKVQLSILLFFMEVVIFLFSVW